jgi:branched-chain amino acid transport system substrate-binding protein
MKKTSTGITFSALFLIFLGITGCTTPFINKEKYEAEATAYFNTGEEFFKKGDYDKAVSTFTSVIKNYPRSQLADDAYYLASLSFAKKKDWEHAVGAALNLAKSYPSSPLIPKTKIILAEGYNNIGMYEEALVSYIETFIISDNPKEREIASSQAKNLLGREKDYNVLSDVYKRFENTDAAEWILYRLGDLSFELENYEASERYISELKRRFPKSPYIDKIGGKDISASKLKSELTIGVLLPLTGSLSSYGLNVKQGIDLANYLKGGATVKLVEYDTRSDPGEALRGAEYLLKEEASVIIGPLTSSGITAVTKAAARNGTVVISPTATDPSLLAQYECLFQLNSYSEEETKAIANYALKQGMTQFGILYPNSENGKLLADVFAKAIERGGGKILYSSQLSDTVTEIQKTIISVRYNPAQAVFLPFSKTQLMSVVPEIAYYRLKVKVLGIDDFADSDILRQGGVPFENVWFASPPCKIETSYPFEFFFSQYKSRYGKDPDWESALGYDAYNFIIAAFSSGKSESLCRSLRQLDNRRGTLGRLVFIDSPQEPSLRIYTIKNEEIKEVVR